MVYLKTISKLKYLKMEKLTKCDLKVLFNRLMGHRH